MSSEGSSLVTLTTLVVSEHGPIVARVETVGSAYAEDRVEGLGSYASDRLAD